MKAALWLALACIALQSCAHSSESKEGPLPQGPSSEAEIATRQHGALEAKEPAPTPTEFESLYPKVSALLEELEGRGCKREEVFDLDGKATHQKVEGPLEKLLRAAKRSDTSRMLELERKACLGYTWGRILFWLARHGDAKLAMPVLLSYLSRPGTTRPGDKDQFWPFVIRAVTSVDDERAWAFFRQHLSTPTSDRAVRHAAYWYLTRSPAQKDLELVRSVRHRERKAPTLEVLCGLKNLGSQPQKGTRRPRAHRYENGVLWDVKQDDAGVRWALFTSKAFGDYEDIWIARWDRDGWTDPVFTGKYREEVVGKDWIRLLVRDKSLRLDSDGDGWTDLAEGRLGTNPNSKDSDGDGLADSEDRNPMAAPRSLSEREEVLAAVFEARFRFIGWNDTVALVELPEGIAPMEFFGADGLVITKQQGAKHPLDLADDNGLAAVTFETSRQGNASSTDSERPERPKPSHLKKLDWKKLDIEVRYGPLWATGHEVELFKLDGEWFAALVNMVWIS